MLILLVWMSSERHTGHTVLRILSAGLILLNKKPHDPQRNHSLLALRDAITEFGYAYEVNEGDGAFYGPKLDFHLQDCLGRTWQCGTIQLDFQLPERFELEYTGADGLKHRPIMIHRVVFGSIERFIGILIEHFAGAFPLWLAPEQVRILPISERHHEKAMVWHLTIILTLPHLSAVFRI